MDAFVRGVMEKAISGGKVSGVEGLRLASDNTPVMDLIYGANSIRERNFGREIRLCAVVNAKSGICSEDCSFCAQSVRWATGVKRFGWIGEESIIEAAAQAREMGASMMGIVTSGPRIDNGEEFDAILRSIERAGKETGLDICASLGMLNKDQARRLRARGLRRYHHNLETSRNFFQSICSTHTFDDMVETVKAAKAAGLEVCCGGIFGLGESWEDRVSLALTLRDLEVDSVPLNFLMPIPGTPLASMPILSPLEALRIVALFRFILPEREIRVCGGREVCLGDHQRWIFHAGASGTMIGNYLTRAGRPPSDDLRMIASLGLEAVR